MKTWKLTLEYDGTRYSGWQEQKNARTIQGELRAAVQEFLGTRVELQGAGRTDAGVHATAQVAHLRADVTRIPSPNRMKNEFNDRLPADIVVLDCVPVPNRFHARHDATARSYVYQISTRKTAFSKKYVWWVKELLDVPLMEKAAGLIPGRRDFVCFGASDPSRPDESTIVLVESATLEQQKDLILFHIEASHFIWRMVRRLAGVLVKVGKQEVTLAEFKSLLNAKTRRGLDVAAWTAPASGLFLDGVRYGR